MNRFRILVSVVALSGMLVPATAAAQQAAQLYVTGYGHGALFGRFLEQEIDGGEREVRAATTGGAGIAFGGLAGKNAGQIAVSWIPTEFDFEDDTGGDAMILDEDGLADLTAYVINFEYLRYFTDAAARFAPYVTSGVSATIWKLGTEGAIVASDSDTVYGFGVVAGLGAEFRPSPGWAVVLEWTNTKVGSPFDGDKAFQVVDGEKLDEPDTVRVTLLKGGISYRF